METSKQYKTHVFGDHRNGDAVEMIGNTTIFGKIPFYDAEADTKGELIDKLAKHFEVDSAEFLDNFFEFRHGIGTYEAGEIAYSMELRYNGEPLSLSEKNVDMDHS